MGTDVHGKHNPDAYFRAGVFSWPGIMHVVELANASHNLGHDLKGWYYNDGAGLETDVDCEALADAIDDVLPRMVGEQPIEHLEQTKSLLAAMQGLGTPMTATVNADGTVADIAPAPSVPRFDAERVRAFVAFLRECRGFEIW